MNRTNTPLNKKQLIRSVVIAIAIGLTVLVTAVLPAEYNIDLLGTGKLFGFSRLYVEHPSEETSVVNIEESDGITIKSLKLEKLGSAASVPKPQEADNPPPAEQYPQRNDTITVVVPAGKGIEYKFRALKHGSVKYEWRTSENNIVYIDFHGEVYQQHPPEDIFYESYTLAYANNMAGTFTAPFEGRHGWYFRNEHKEELTVTICLQGQYKLLEK